MRELKDSHRTIRRPYTINIVPAAPWLSECVRVYLVYIVYVNVCVSNGNVVKTRRSAVCRLLRRRRRRRVEITRGWVVWGWC